MKILLVSATKFEIEPLLKASLKSSAKQNLYSFRSGKNSVDILITGVGMTSTAFQLGKALCRKYDLAINAGVAGSFRKNISLGSIVNVTSDCFADLGAEDGNKFLTAKEIGLVSDLSFRNTFKNKITETLPKVKAITVNTVHGNASSIKKAVNKFNPDIESMEGAAFFYSCAAEKVKCVQLRAISNYVKRRNKKKWEMNLAIRNLNSVLETFLQSI